MGRTSSQDRCIDEQLSMGIRYFDLRIAHKPGDPSCDLYFTHVIYTHLTVMVSALVISCEVPPWCLLVAFLIVVVLPSQDTLVSAAAWLESHPKEVVILACSHFEGMDDALHQAFISSLKRLFGSKLCPQTVRFLAVQLEGKGGKKHNLL